MKLMTKIEIRAVIEIIIALLIVESVCAIFVGMIFGMDWLVANLGPLSLIWITMYLIVRYCVEMLF